MHDFGFDARVLAFTLLAALLSGVVSGVAPALQFARLMDLMKAAGRSSTAVRASRMARVVVISEVALAVALSCCAGMLIRSSMLLLGMPRGINPHDVLTIRIWLPRAKYSDAYPVTNFYREVLRRIQQLAGVESASAINFPPLALQSTAVNLTIEGRAPTSPDEVFNARCSVISPEYFRTMNIPQQM
jgi:hypothetical protein